MDLKVALQGIFTTENQLRSTKGIIDPVLMSESMARLATYTYAAEEKLAELEKDYELNQAILLNKFMMQDKMKVSQAERQLDIELGKIKGEIKYVSRIIGSAWKHVSVIQSRINHLLKESQI